MEKSYIYPILDLFNGEIITYTIGSRPTYSLISTMLDQAFERLTDDDTLLIHSDQGWHYQMKQYRNAGTWHYAKYVSQRELLR
ncbi:transposase InsO family protein [Peribacillus simplex]|nr:transposase InsO family protein [Peribacillus simplex]